MERDDDRRLGCSTGSRYDDATSVRPLLLRGGATATSNSNDEVEVERNPGDDSLALLIEEENKVACDLEKNTLKEANHRPRSRDRENSRRRTAPGFKSTVAGIGFGFHRIKYRAILLASVILLSSALLFLEYQTILSSIVNVAGTISQFGQEYILPPIVEVDLGLIHQQQLAGPGKVIEVPNVVHIIHQPQAKDMPYWMFINLLSILDVQQPDWLYIHLLGTLGNEGDSRINQTTNDGSRWATIFRHNKTRVIPERNVGSIFGNPVNEVAHKADVIRLEALLAVGGIYLDSDVLVLNSFGPLMSNPMVMGIESEGNLGNSVLLSVKNSSFVWRWYNQYRTFDDNNWDTHSVKLPWKLASLYPREIVLAPKSAWFSPDYGSTSKRLFGDTFPEDISQHFAQHLWNHVAADSLSLVSHPSYFCQHKSPYARAVVRMNNSRFPLLHAELSKARC